MKIVCTDNFARETQSERFVAENIRNEREAKIMLDALRKTCTDHEPDWYKLVPDDYVLYRFEP